jgi:hypothetical protein
MSKRVLLFTAAALMATSSAGFVRTAMAGPRHVSVQDVCTSAGFQQGNLQYSDCVKTLQGYARSDVPSSRANDATYAVPNESRFTAYAGNNSGPRPDLDAGAGHLAAVRACEGLGLHSQTLRQCVGNLDAAMWQEEISGQG